MRTNRLIKSQCVFASFRFSFGKSPLTNPHYSYTSRYLQAEKTMNTEDFVKGVYQTKEEMIKSYFDNTNNTYVGELIKSLNIDSKQMETLKKIIDGTLTDGFYSLLVGIDGGASIGNNLQQEYKLFDEENNSLTEDITGFAYDYFQESNL